MPSKYITSSRTISTDIIDDKRVNSLSSFIEIATHFRIILKMDNMGRIEADPDMLRSMIFPRNPSVSSKKVANICQSLHDTGLYFLYEVNGERYLQSPSFHRQRMVGNMERNSALPPPPVVDFLDWLMEVRQDKRFVDEDRDTSLELVSNMVETGIYRTRREENKKGKEEKVLSLDGGVFKAYEQNIGILTPMIGEKIKDALTIYPEQWIEEAIGIAVKQNKRRWSYIEAILKRWEVEGKGQKTEHESKQLSEYD